MPVRINNIQKHSLADSLPIKKNYTILSIDDILVFDILDIMFFSQKKHFTIKYEDEKHNILSCKVENKFDKPLGYEVLLPDCKNCINNCIFCFIDQMPNGLRASLYVKDDDFIYSFFYGNFISLTNLNQKDIDKIKKQHISPLYVSIHTTDTSLHKDIFRYDIDFNVMEALKTFEEAGIYLHIQIVLIPDVNDKIHLKKSLTDLLKMKNVVSIGIVPVGLTKYRSNLTDLRKISKKEAIALLSQVEELMNLTNTPESERNIFCADEIFITADLPIPDDSYYGNYDQIENGIGMARMSLENWKLYKKKIIKLFLSFEDDIVFITSVSGNFVISPIIRELQETLKNKNVRTIVIKNEFFGEGVTITGLLTWQDIKNQINLTDKECLVFSSGIFNYDMITIDDIHVSMIKKEIDKKIIVVDELFTHWSVY